MTNKPTCKTCKWWDKNQPHFYSDWRRCMNEDMMGMVDHCRMLEEHPFEVSPDFGCIFHEEKEDD